MSMAKVSILSALVVAFMSIHRTPTMADASHTPIPVGHIDKAGVSQRHPETIPAGKALGDCNEQYPC